MLRQRARDACAPSPLLEPLRCPQGGGLAGSPRKHCPAGDRKLNCSPHAGTPLVAGLQDPNPALSEGRSVSEGPSWHLSPSPLPIAHVERWVDAALALLCCQIISGHHHRRTLQGVCRLRSRGVLGALLGGARPCWQLGAGTLPAVPAVPTFPPSRQPLPVAGPVAVAWVGCPLPPPSSPSYPPAASAGASSGAWLIRGQQFSRLRRIAPRAAPGPPRSLAQMPPSHLDCFPLPPVTKERNWRQWEAMLSDAGLAALITRCQELLQALLASTVTAALTPRAGRVRDPGLIWVRARLSRSLRRHAAAAARWALRGVASGLPCSPRGEAAPQTPPRAGGLLGAMAAKHNTGICPRGRGTKGCVCSRVSSPGLARGLGSICGDEPHAQQDGEGWLRSAELHAWVGGRGGRGRHP